MIPCVVLFCFYVSLVERGSSLMAMKSGRNGSRRRAIFTIVVFVLMVLVFFVVLATWSDSETDPLMFTNEILNEFDLEAGDFKLDKQANIGDPNAPVKVLQFVDYKCPYCKAWNDENFDKFKEEYIETGKVQLYIINFPFLGPDSIRAAMVAEILWKQNSNAFWEFHDAIYHHQGDKSTIWATEEFLLDLIENYVPSGDAAAVKKSLRKNEGLFEVKEDFAITQTNGINKVPSFFVNGKTFPNPTLIDLSREIDIALAAYAVVNIQK